MPEKSSAGELRSADDPWYGGSDDSNLRTVINVTPGLRLVVREFRRITGWGSPRNL